MTDREVTIFELIDLTFGNVVNDFADVADALASIRRLAGIYGWDAVQNLALMQLAGDEQTLVAMQASLADLAAEMEHATATSRVP